VLLDLPCSGEPIVSAKCQVIGAGLLLLLSILPPCAAAPSSPNMVHGMVYFTRAQGAGPLMNALIARRYALGVAGLEIAQNAQEIKHLNPDFEWYVYNSITDNLVGSSTDPEDALISRIAARHGWDHEEAYLHFRDDTSLILEGKLVSVPGWGGGSAASKAQARVPVYRADLSRRVVNFSTPEARQLNKEVILALTLDRVFDNTSLHPDGIFFDNCAYQLYNTGQITKGGHVLETPGYLQVESAEFQLWHWYSNLGPFLTVLMDTLRTSATWSPDGRRKLLAINVANAWTDSYVSMSVADLLYLEFQYDPVRCFGGHEVEYAWQRDRLAAAAGMRTLYLPARMTEVSGLPGSFSPEEAYLGSLAWYMTTRSDGSVLNIESSGLPSDAGWDTLSWRGCVDVVERQLGRATGDPYTLSEGTDPTGKPYRVWARRYENGLVLVRNRGRWDEGIEPGTAVTIPLPGPMASVSPSGRIHTAVSSVALRNGGAAILLGDASRSRPRPGPPGGYFVGSPTFGKAPLTVVFKDWSTGSPASWSWSFGDGGTSTAQNPTHAYEAAGTYAVRLTVGNAQGSNTMTRASCVTVVAPAQGFGR